MSHVESHTKYKISLTIQTHQNSGNVRNSGNRAWII